MLKEIEKQKIIFEGRVPPKNRFIQLLYLMEWPLATGFGSRLVCRYLKNCKNISFIPGFRTLYNNIYADNAFFCDRFFLDYAPIYIGNNAKFSFQNMIITSMHDLEKFDRIIAAPVYIGNNVWITSRCLVLPGVKIGDNSVIGAGSVVTTDIPANVFAAGNPARIIHPVKR